MLGGASKYHLRHSKNDLLLILLLVLLPPAFSLAPTMQRVLNEQTWRAAALEHRTGLLRLLSPGLIQETEGRHTFDRQNPIYNFLSDYYGFKGSKGVKRLLRWSPGSCILEGVQESDFATVLPLRGLSSYETGIAIYDPLALQTINPAPFLWYRNVLSKTLHAEPILHCYGLHEFAMQYGDAVHHYQSLTLRVEQDVIKSTVERKGVHCTHVDALQYFTKDALPLNVHEQYKRSDQLRWEQPACVHSQMDLIQYGMRLQPFVDARLIRDIIAVVLEARKLDVAASPYDATPYGLSPVPVETKEGRKLYRKRQTEIMRQAQPLRKDLLEAYESFISVAFSPEDVQLAVARQNENAMN